MRKHLFAAGLATLFACSAMDHHAIAQVFDEAAGAGVGQKLYGTFGLNADSANPSDSSYGIYRKYEALAGDPLHTLANTEGNTSSATWDGLAQNATAGFLAPGVFIGNSPATSSYEDNLIYFKEATNTEGPLAGQNGDFNQRWGWDLRFGFLEDPQNFIDVRGANSERWDLWDGDWGTDGVAVQLFDAATDSEIDSPTGDTDHFTNGNGQGYFFQSGESPTDIGTQGDREGIEWERRYVGSDEALDVNSPVNNGVSYEDAVEVGWNMELNDPANANEVAAREVKIEVKMGSVIYSAVFDPGTADDPVRPNPQADFFNDYTDGFFDWENSTPVFFVGMQGNFEAGGEATMGVFQPGDYSADGITNVDDLGRWNQWKDQSSTTYSRADQDQNGITELADAQMWADSSTPEALAEAIATVQADIDAGGSNWDLDGSGGPTNAADLNFLIVDIIGEEVPMDVCGDFDRDGDVDSADRTIQTTNWTGALPPGDPNATKSFEQGDCDADGDVDTADQNGTITNWTGAMNPAGNLVDGGDADLIYDPATGNVKLDAGDTSSGMFISFVLGTGENNMRPENLVKSTDGSAGPFFDVGTNTDATTFQIGQTDPLNQGAGPVIDLGDVFPAGIDSVEALADYLTLAEYASELGSGGTFDLALVPEPSGLALALIGMLGLVSRRRK